jgi:glucose-6-phosphatase
MEFSNGSPSGHMMVSTAVCVTLLLVMNRRQPAARYWLSRCCSVLVVTFLSLVGLSRCFIATHFPHQVVFGTIVGVAIAVLFDRLDISKLGLRSYALVSAALLASSMSMYRVLPSFGVDPMWSVSLARRHCLRQDWVHLDTTLLYSFVRDSSAPLGLGLGLFLQFTSICFQSPSADTPVVKTKTFFQLLLAVFSVVFAQLSEFVTLPRLDGYGFSSELTFYAFAGLRCCLVVLVVVVLTGRWHVNNSRFSNCKEHPCKLH